MDTSATVQSDRFQDFVQGIEQLLSVTREEPQILTQARQLLGRLIAVDDWLPASHAQARSNSYAQYLLHGDPQGRFSVVSFVWGPGQKTPVHDHTVWGLVGMLRGEELCEEYELVEGRPVFKGCSHVLRPGQIEAVSPTVGDWHRVSNALADQPSISIHVYGADIGKVRRHRVDQSGAVVDFVSGYTPLA